jgi:hypothetical protein
MKSRQSEGRGQFSLRMQANGLLVGFTTSTPGRNPEPQLVKEYLADLLEPVASFVHRGSPRPRHVY